MGAGSTGLLGVGSVHDCLLAVKLKGLGANDQPIQVEASDYVSVMVTRSRNVLGWGLACDLGLSDDPKKIMYSPQPLPFFARRQVCVARAVLGATYSHTRMFFGCCL
jgi:hypothetical protein